MMGRERVSEPSDQIRAVAVTERNFGPLDDPKLYHHGGCLDLLVHVFGHKSDVWTPLNLFGIIAVRFVEIKNYTVGSL